MNFSQPDAWYCGDHIVTKLIQRWATQCMLYSISHLPAFQMSPWEVLSHPAALGPSPSFCLSETGRPYLGFPFFTVHTHTRPPCFVLLPIPTSLPHLLEHFHIWVRPNAASPKRKQHVKTWRFPQKSLLPRCDKGHTAPSHKLMDTHSHILGLAWRSSSPHLPPAFLLPLLVSSMGFSPVQSPGNPAQGEGLFIALSVV